MCSNLPTPPESVSPDSKEIRAPTGPSTSPAYDQGDNSDKIEALHNFLNNNREINLIRLHWVDYSGVLRARIVPKSHLFKIAQGHRTYSVPQNCMIIPVSSAPECFPEGPERWNLVPDWSSLRPCGVRPTHATVFCSVSQQEPEARSHRCPRRLLEDSLQVFAQRFSTDILIGFEIEFVLLDKDSEIDRPLDRLSAYSSMAGLRDTYLKIMEETVEVMEVSGIKTYHFHAEAIDQLEIALDPLPPMEAIDALMCTQETLRTIAIRHGLKATTCPKPVINGPRNGCHMHISLTNSAKSDRFLAGILRKLRLLCAFGMPNWDSYARHGPDMAGTWVGYGTENRDLPVRKIGKSHWEIRIVDATANIYLFLAIVLSAASDAVENSWELLWKDCTAFPGDLAPEKLAECFQKKLPESFADALQEAREDADIKKWIGSSLLKSWMKVKEKEVELFSDMEPKDIRQKFLDSF